MFVCLFVCLFVPGPRQEAAQSVNEELIAGASSDSNVDRIRTSRRAVLKP